MRNKLYSLINITGLAIGIACCVLIYLYVRHEKSYDAYHEKGDRIFRMTTVGYKPNKTDYFAPTSPIMANRLYEQFPEVESFVRFNPSMRPLSYKDRKFYDTRLFYADSGLLQVFTFPMLEGDMRSALNKPYSIVLCESTAKKYFGSGKAYGQLMQLSDTLNVMVTGVIRDIPSNSHFSFDGFLSRITMNDMNRENPEWQENNEQNWFNCNTYSYLLLKENASAGQLVPKMNAFMDKEQAEIKKQVGMWMNINLQPITDIHLRSHLDAEYKGNNNSDIRYVYIFTGSAILILLIACSNFINLSTARSLNRSREIGLRKAIGAGRLQLIGQFLGESMLFALLGSLLSLLLVLPGISLFNTFTGTALSMDKSLFAVYAIVIISVGFLAGAYPALLMSSFSPVRSLKGQVKHGAGDVTFRKGLVVFQFSIAIALIIGTVVVLSQLQFMLNRDIGMDREQVIALELKPQDNPRGKLILKELERLPGVTAGALNGFSFKGMANITLLPEGTPENELTSCSVFSVDEDFLSMLRVPFAAGRNFSEAFPTDASEGFIVNEAAVKAFNWKTPQAAIGKKVIWAFGKEGKVIGVVKDFNFSSLRESIKPVLIHIYQPWFNAVSLRLKTENLAATLSKIESTWKQTALQSPFKYAFLNDDFDHLYRGERQLQTVLGVFTALSIFVACLGLFGLAAFMVKQRFREIGIRKVLGSSVPAVVNLLSRDFMKLVLISVAIACPLAWYAMRRWLQDFAYKIEIGWWVFLLAGLTALLVAFATVCFQAVKAARANPVKSLRAE